MVKFSEISNPRKSQSSREITPKNYRHPAKAGIAFMDSCLRRNDDESLVLAWLVPFYSFF